MLATSDNHNFGAIEMWIVFLAERFRVCWTQRYKNDDGYDGGETIHWPLVCIANCLRISRKRKINKSWVRQMEGNH